MSGGVSGVDTETLEWYFIHPMNTIEPSRTSKKVPPFCSPEKNQKRNIRPTDPLLFLIWTTHIIFLKQEEQELWSGLVCSTSQHLPLSGGKLSGWEIVEWEIVGWEKIRVGFCRSEKLSRWENVWVGNCRVGNCRVGNCRMWCCPVGNCRVRNCRHTDLSAWHRRYSLFILLSFLWY